MTAARPRPILDKVRGGGHDGGEHDSTLNGHPRPHEFRLFEQLLKLRYISVVVVLISILHAVAFLFLGAQIAIRAYRLIGAGTHPGESLRSGLEMLHSLDFLLIALVLLILGLGVTKLFLLSPGAAASQSGALPSWLRIDTFSDLKALLWETILTALLVFGLPTLAVELVGKLEWNALVLPAAIFLLALGLFFMKRA